MSDTYERTPTPIHLAGVIVYTPTEGGHERLRTTDGREFDLVPRNMKLRPYLGPLADSLDLLERTAREFRAFVGTLEKPEANVRVLAKYLVEREKTRLASADRTPLDILNAAARLLGDPPFVQVLPTDAPEFDREIKVGDRVFVGPGVACLAPEGTEGEVTRCFPGGDLQVDFPDHPGIVVSPSKLRLLLPPELNRYHTMLKDPPPAGKPSEVFLSGYNAGKYAGETKRPYDVTQAWQTYLRHGGCEETSGARAECEIALETRGRTAMPREALIAEIELLRGVGCEANGDGPCGVCIKCAAAGRHPAYPKPLDAWKAEEDQPLPEDDAIHAAFPTESNRHDLYQEASRLVGARYSKGGLIALVTWLLLRVASADGATDCRECGWPYDHDKDCPNQGRPRVPRSVDETISAAIREHGSKNVIDSIIAKAKAAHIDLTCPQCAQCASGVCSAHRPNVTVATLGKIVREARNVLLLARNTDFTDANLPSQALRDLREALNALPGEEEALAVSKRERERSGEGDDE